MAIRAPDGANKNANSRTTSNSTTSRQSRKGTASDQEVQVVESCEGPQGKVVHSLRAMKLFCFAEC